MCLTAETNDTVVWGKRLISAKTVVKNFQYWSSRTNDQYGSNASKMKFYNRVKLPLHHKTIIGPLSRTIIWFDVVSQKNVGLVFWGGFKLAGNVIYCEMWSCTMKRNQVEIKPQLSFEFSNLCSLSWNISINIWGPQRKSDIKRQ